MKYLSKLNLVQPVTATGTNGLRQLADRFADIINIRDQIVGVGLGNSSVDTIALLQAVAKATATPGSTIWFPAGSYTFAVPANQVLIACPSKTKFVGAGRDETILNWNDDAGNTLFGTSTTSSARGSNIIFSGFTLVGSGSVRAFASVLGFNLSYIDGLEFIDIGTSYSRNTAVSASYCSNVSATNCDIRYAMGDGVNFQGCTGVAVNDNRIHHIDGDAVSINSDTLDQGKVRRNISVTGNRIFDAQGIRIMSARHATLSGNQMDAIKSYAINLSTVAPNGSGNLVGVASGIAVSITGNTITNMINRQNIDNETQGCPAIILSGSSARAGTYNAIPGEADHSTGTIIDPYREIFANANSATTPTGGIYAITVSGNTIARTLPACNNSDARYKKWSDFGLGAIYTKTGSLDPSLSESDLRDAGVLIQGGIVRDVMITANIMRGLDCGLALMNGVRYDNINYRGNDVVDCYSNGVIVNTSGLLRVYVDDNTFDLDPYLKHPNRGSHGTWQTASGPTGINQIAGTGVYVRRNILRNMTLDYSGDSSMPTNGVYWDANIVEAQPTVLNQFSTSNKGVGLVRSNSGTLLSVVDSDPSSSTFGAVLTMPQTPTASLIGRASSGSGVNEVIALGSGLVLSNGALSVSFPSPLYANAISAVGSVASITVTIAAGYRAFPTLTVAAPPAGGAQASAIVSTMGLYSSGGFATIGSGYVVGDVLTVNGGTFGLAATIRVTTINGSGGITGSTVASQGTYTVLPTGTLTLSGGTGSGATVSNCLFTPLTVTVTAAGGGYPSSPAIAFSSYLGSSASGVAILSNNFAMTGGNGQIQLTNVGTILGTSGSLGYGTVLNGTLFDQSKVRQSVTGAATTIPANTSWYAMTQSGTISAQSLSLPMPVGDGQILRISTVGAITALTLTPTVGVTVGWTNGSPLAASSGLTLGFDAASSSWMRL